MALQPIVFTPPRRDPSLVQQAIVGTLTGLVRKKLIDEPLLKRQEEFYTGEREERQEFATGERKAGERASKARARLTGVTLPLELAKKTEEVQRGLGIVPGLEDVRTAEIRAIQELDPEFQPSALPETRREQVGRRAARQSLMDDLLAQARTEATISATEQARTTNRANVLLGLAANAPLLLVKDAETGKERMTLPSESAAYMVGTTGLGDVLQQYGDDPDTQSIVRDYQQAYISIGADNFRLAPDFDAAAFNEMLDKLTSATDPDATKFNTLLQAGKHLEELGLLKDDAGNFIQYPEAGGEGTLVVNMRSGSARHRLAGYQLAQRVFPTRESFEAYEKVSSPYLFSPVMRETMEAVWNSRGDARTPGAAGAEGTDVDRRSRGTTTDPALAPSTAPLQTPGAVSLLEEHPNLTPFLESRAREFASSSNPDSLYSQRYQQIVDYFSGPFREVYDRLVNDKIISRGALRAQSQFGVDAPVNIPALQANFIAALDAARDEAETRRQ